LKRNQSIALVAVLAIILIAWFTLKGDENQERDITTMAFVADFKDLVTSSGELMAKNSEDINGPSNSRQYGLFNIKISDLVAEGTYVEKGDFVAQLDKTELSSKLNDLLTEYDKAQSIYTQTQLDTTLEMREKRSELESLVFDIRQKKIEIEQSIYEPPASIQRLKLDLEKLDQSLAQKKDNYIIKQKQSQAKMVEAGATLSQTRNKLSSLQDLEKEFRILAPKKGMVIYKREWGGRKRKTGSNISPWDPGVATLPDLSEMQSKTYINEVDIRKVKQGQNVMLGLDAFPDASLTGEIIEVANVGEDREDSDSKVFEIIIKVIESDSTYRPGMTTSNEIITKTLKQVLQIPLEAIFNQDGITFVYLQSGVSVIKQEVRIGASNDEYAVIEEGIEEEDEVFLTEPTAGIDAEINTLSAS
jgi:HlyD family secretion protein